jgi:hypothetical protein
VEVAAVHKGLGQLDKGDGIPHEEIKKQLASWLVSPSRKLFLSPNFPDLILTHPLTQVVLT